MPTSQSVTGAKARGGRGVLSLALGAMLMLTLSACAERMQTQVSRFHTISAPPAGEKVLIEPADPARAGIEFAGYADLVGQELGQHGYQPAKGETPDIIARLAFEVVELPGAADGGSSTRIGLGIGGGGRHLGGGLGTSFGLGGSEPQSSYVRRLMVVMIDADSGQRIYEGRVESRGRNPDLAAVMPYLVEALFREFPGTSGETKMVKLDVDD